MVVEGKERAGEDAPTLIATNRMEKLTATIRREAWTFREVFAVRKEMVSFTT